MSPMRIKGEENQVDPVSDEDNLAINSTRSEVRAIENPQRRNNDSDEEDSEYSTSDFRPKLYNRRRPDDGTIIAKPSLLRNIVQNITIEPMVFLQMISLTCTAVILQNFYIERVCQKDFNQTKAFCSNLTENPDLDHGLGQKIEAQVASYNLCRTVIEAAFPILFSLFLGPWTDKHGTKIPMLLPLLGMIISSISYIYFSLNDEIRAVYFLFSAIPMALSGGLVAMILSMFSFITIKSDEENRSFRIAMLEACWFLGAPLGYIAGAAIFKRWGFTVVFSFASTCQLLSFIYGLIVIRDKRELPEHTETNMCLDMFNVQAVKEIFVTVVKPRENNRRKWIIILLSALVLRIFGLFGAFNVLYLMAREKFSWDEQDMTRFTVLDSTIQIAGTFSLTMVTMKIFKADDAFIGIFSTIGYCISALVFAFSTAGWMMYLASALQMFSGLITIVIRAMLSKCVEKEEVAKIFTFIACGESCIPIFSSIVYNLLFMHTIKFFPGAVFILSFVISGIVLSIFVYLYISMRKMRYSLLSEEDSHSIFDSNNE